MACTPYGPERRLRGIRMFEIARTITRGSKTIARHLLGAVVCCIVAAECVALLVALLLWPRAFVALLRTLVSRDRAKRL